MIRIGVLGTSGIAERRMIPAIRKEASFQYAGVGFSTRKEMAFSGTEAEFAPLLAEKKKKAARFQSAFGGKCYESYDALLSDPDIDAVYIALPPALHFRWAMEALQRGKHVLLEKPFTTREEDTEKLLGLAEEKQLAMVENYGFPLHAQMDIIRQWLAEDAIGELRQVRATFGFPHRDEGDFRYHRALGGGALLDCGGYTLKAATVILGPETEILAASSRITEGHEVDIVGNVLMKNREGICAQLAYGMDHDYRCELELWGSKGTITAGRFFTAPDGFPAPVCLKRNQETEEKTASDDQFLRIVQHFGQCIASAEMREKEREAILLQGRLTERVRSFG